MQLRTLLINICLLTGFLLTVAATLHAETVTEYAIDIVVFEDSEARYRGSEQWTASADAIDSGSEETSLTGRLDSALKPNIRDINASNYDLLNGAVKRLNNSSRYRVLARKTWLQPGLDSSHAVELALNSANSSEPTGRIAGTVKVVLERYLHLYNDLVYQPASTGISSADNVAATSDPTAVYVIKEHRRMRSKEVHYIDHPLVGILIKIVPVETTIKDSQQPSSPAADQQ